MRPKLCSQWQSSDVCKGCRAHSLTVATVLFLLGAYADAEPPSMRIQRGELDLTIRDNSSSPQVLSGIARMMNTVRASGFDAFDPDTPGASAGLNFEHIISGHRNKNNAFTPRSGPFTLSTTPDGNGAVLTRKAADSPWNVESTMTYKVVPPHYVDFEFRCVPRDAALFGKRGYAIFFFANYMNDVADVALNFLGQAGQGKPTEWISADAPDEHTQWVQGGNYRALQARDLSFDDDVKFSLNTWSYDWPRVAEPFYYGRAAHGMTMILMFDRLFSPRDQIRFSLYKFKVPKHPRPAWDFQYVINRVVADQAYGFRGRLVWKSFVSKEDCLDEYQRWSLALKSAETASNHPHVLALRRKGAQVFQKGDRVIEVNANGTSVNDEDLARLKHFSQLTDVSLEQTQISDAGLQHLAALPRLEWLNLYRTNLGNQGLASLANIQSLQHLPIGETQVTDDGLHHLKAMSQLVYLGLRGNPITDEGVAPIGVLTNLEGLYLGETKLRGPGLKKLLGLVRLQHLWINDTAIDDRSVDDLAKLRALRELYVYGTSISEDGLQELRRRLPNCHVVSRRE